MSHASRLRRSISALGRALPPLVAAGLAVAAVAPALAVPGLLATHAAGDSPFLLQRVHQISDALAAGHIPPRWMPDAAYGLGYPFWNYYSPLAYLVAGGLVVLGGGFVGAIKVTLLLCFVGAAAGAYRLGRAAWGSRGAGMLVSAAYTLAPYHLVNVYVRGDALAELAAYALFPWVLLAIDRALARPSACAAAGLAIAVGLLLVSHNVSALLFAPVVVAYAAWRLVARRRWRLAAAAASTGGSSTGGASTGLAATRRPRPPVPPAVPSAAVVPAGRGWSRLPVLARRALLVAEHRLWRWQPRGRARAGAVMLFGLGLGGLLAAWFVLPAAFLERDAVQLQGNLTGYFHYANHFRGLDLVDMRPWFDYRVDSVTGAPTRMGLAQLVAAVLGAAVALARLRSSRGRSAEADGVAPIERADGDGRAPIERADGDNRPDDAWRGPLLFWLAVAVATTLMITPLSRPLWDRVPLLPFAQFPWRWLGVQSLALALLAGPLAAGMLRNRGRRPGTPVAAGLIGLAAAAVLAAAALVRVPVEALSVNDVTRADLAAFEVFTGNIGTTVRGEYLPKAVAPRPMSSVDAVAGHEGGPRIAGGAGALGSGALGSGALGSGALESATLFSREADHQEWQIRRTGADPTTIAFPTLWFPGWMASIDDGPLLPTSALPGSGWITVDIDTGQCDGRCILRLSLQRSNARALAEALSLAAALIVLALLLFNRRRPWGRYLVAAVAGVPMLVLAARVLPVGSDSGPITLDTLHAPYPHTNPAGIRFGRARLMNARLTPRTGSQDIENLTVATERQLDAGDTLMVNLNWTTPQDAMQVTAALVSPAEPVFGVPDIVDEATQAPDDPEAMVLEVPNDAVTGLYFIRLTVTEDGEPVRPRSAGGSDLGAVYLGPLRVRAKPDLVKPPGGIAGIMGDITLQELKAERVEIDHRGWLAVSMIWRTDRALTVDYMTSVRLLDARAEPVVDADGQPVQEDKMPRYGFLPTTSWKPGEYVADRRWLKLPENLAAGADYAVKVVVYDGATMKETGSAQITGVTARE